MTNHFHPDILYPFGDPQLNRAAKVRDQSVETGPVILITGMALYVIRSVRIAQGNGVTDFGSVPVAPTS